MNCIEVSDLYKSFNSSDVLKNINFQIKKGTIVALLGADGSGKTTLLRLLCGLLCQDKGEIKIFNINPQSKKKDICDYISYMPQKFGLYEDLSVIENLNLYQKLKNTNLHHEELLNFCGLAPFKHRLAKNLSGGMKQKLGLACALLGKPKVLILDEPSVGVDPVSRIELLELVRKNIDSETCVIWSTSYLDEAYDFDLSIILDKGKLIFNGDTKKLGANSEKFEKKVIELMGGYTQKNSNIAKNYHIKDFNIEYYVIAENLSKNYGDFWAVKKNSFSIKKGEVFGLLGPNGAGKSTTFKMMCGLIGPTSGKGYIIGYDITKNPQKAREHLGYMAQKFSLYSRLSILDNLNFFAGAYGLFGQNKKEKIEKIIKTFELEDYKNTQADLLPLGFKQRLSLACALIHEPNILFLDEPTSGVDIIQRKEFWTHIKSLANLGVSVLVTTHFMDEAKFCDKISLFYNGEIIALDKPENIIKKANAKNMQEAFISTIKIHKGEI